MSAFSVSRRNQEHEKEKEEDSYHGDQNEGEELASEVAQAPRHLLRVHGHHPILAHPALRPLYAILRRALLAKTKTSSAVS